jgi:alcohol/geraniol dehydrogenase (NADP+)
MSNLVRGYAALEAHGRLEVLEYDLGALKPRQVEVAVQYCGVCHSDVSMWANHWGFTAYPFVPGHEIVGKVVAVGEQVGRLKVGDTVGVGWFAKSCMECTQCMGGDHNLCATAEQTIVGRPGGFAERVRCSEEWATKLPEKMDIKSAGPLFCGGITVFSPMVEFGVRPTDRVGVVGIGGLGHMAVQFLNKWGCEVTAFTSSDSKRDEAIRLGAHHVVNSGKDEELGKIARSLDFILVTANVDLNWMALVAALRPKGRLHFVGVVPSPIALSVFPMILGQASVSASPLGSPSTVEKMTEFCTRHYISPQVEYFPMSQVNEAFAHLEAGKARYRIVLENDLA